MSQRSPKIWAALAGAALLYAAPAEADPIPPASLVPALDVYVDALAAGHAGAIACAATWPASKADEAGWQQAKAILTASLWANDFPTDFVRTATQRLDAPPAAVKIDCAHPDPALAGQFGWPSQVGWVEVVQEGLEGMDLAIIAQPVAPATWTTVKDMIAKALPNEKRLLDCVAVMYPETLPTMVHDWDSMLAKIDGSLITAGLPRDEVSATVSGAEANQIWHRVTTDGEAELRDSCRQDKAVQQSLGNFESGGLGPAIDKLLPSPNNFRQRLMAGVVVVTGASRGIGAATARLLAGHGYAVVVNYAASVEAATVVVAGIERAGGVAVAVRGDVASEADVEHIFAAADRLGPLVGLVNNAGMINRRARVDEMDAEAVMRLLAVNVLGSLLCARAAIRRMSSRHGGKGGAIVNVTSGASKLGAPATYVDYAASKGAIDSFTIGLALEVAAEGIRVNAVRPGIIDTDFHAAGGEPDRASQLAASIPMGRSGTSEEVADAILWLLSPQSAYTTGTTIVVSGGRAIQP